MSPVTPKGMWEHPFSPLTEHGRIPSFFYLTDHRRIPPFSPHRTQKDPLLFLPHRSQKDPSIPPFSLLTEHRRIPSFFPPHRSQERLPILSSQNREIPRLFFKEYRKIIPFFPHGSRQGKVGGGSLNSLPSENTTMPPLSPLISHREFSHSLPSPITGESPHSPLRKYGKSPPFSPLTKHQRVLPSSCLPSESPQPPQAPPPQPLHLRSPPSGPALRDPRPGPSLTSIPELLAEELGGAGGRQEGCEQDGGEDAEGAHGGGLRVH